MTLVKSPVETLEEKIGEVRRQIVQRETDLMQLFSALASLKTNREEVIHKKERLEASALGKISGDDFDMTESVLRLAWHRTDEDFKDRLKELSKGEKKTFKSAIDKIPQKLDAGKQASDLDQAITSLNDKIDSLDAMIQTLGRKQDAYEAQSKLIRAGMGTALDKLSIFFSSLESGYSNSKVVQTQQIRQDTPRRPSLYIP